jgi:multisubunit Na+/H+ antiporter MnhB subunit
MSSLWGKYGITISVIAIVIGAFVTFMGNDALSFPAFEHRASDASLVPAEPYGEIAEHASRFLWESRALDLTVQAFVITAAVICCLALIKPEEVEA